MSARMADTIKIIKRDMKLILEDEKKKDENFSLDLDESKITGDVRKLRWQNDVTNYLSSMMSFLKQKEESEKNYKKQLDEISESNRMNDEVVNKIRNEQKDLKEKYTTIENENIDLKRDIKILVDEKTSLNERMSRLENKMIQLNDEITEQENDLFQIKEKINEEISEKVESQEILVRELLKNFESLDINRSKNSKSQIKIKTPEYKGDVHDRPLTFLSELNRYVNIYKSNDESEVTLISQCLVDSAKEWFYLIESEIHNLKDFEKLFKQRYWSDEIKESLQKKIEIGTFNPNRNLSRTQYATQLFRIAKDIYTDKTEIQVIKKISNHFGREIKIFARSNRINNKLELLTLLEEFHREDEQMKRRKSYAQKNKNRNDKNHEESNQENKENSSDESRTSDNDSEGANKKQPMNRNYQNAGRYEKTHLTQAMCIEEGESSKSSIEN